MSLGMQDARYGLNVAIADFDHERLDRLVYLQ